MSKLFERAVKRLNTGLAHVAGVTVSVFHGTDTIESLAATPGRRDVSQYLMEEAAGTAKEFDWIVAANELFFPSLGKKCEPESGWEIWWVPEEGLQAGRTLVFKVLPGGTGKCFETVDQYGILYRVHTKFERYAEGT